MSAVLPAKFRRLYEQAPRFVKDKFALWNDAVRAVDAAPNGDKLKTARIFGRRLGVRVSTVYGRRALFRRHGPIALFDKCWSRECWPQRPDMLPSPAIAFLQRLATNGQLTQQSAIRVFSAQLRRWQAGDASAKIPGWKQPPQGNPPPGCSVRNLTRHLRAAVKHRPKMLCRFTVTIYADGSRTITDWRKRQ